jgi:acyl-coenzyme A thioesterase PaaI-like protein
MCFVCGLENKFGLRLKFYQTGPTEVTAHYTVPDQYQGYPGITHGGIVAAMLDEVVGRAIMGTEPSASRFMYTLRLTIRYRKNVPINVPLRIVGQVEKVKMNSVVSKGAIYGPEGDVLAEAEGVLFDIPEEILAGIDREALGWKTYGDGDPQ